MKKILLPIALVALVLPTTAHAQLVARACGQIPCTYEQFKAGELAWYQKLDVNHDGIIDAAEQTLAWQTYAQDILPACKNIQDVKTLKLNHVPTDENIRKTFNTIDLDGDGIVDAEEDRQATRQLNATCQLMQDPQVQKLQQMLQKLQQGK
jgi:Ca2+-binding EF-hand superfamily protein